MVEMTAPTPDDIDLRPGQRHLRLPRRRRRVHPRQPPRARSPTRRSRSTSTTRMFHGYDFDNTMLRIGSMNMQLHGVAEPEHHLPRLPRRGPRRRHRGLQPGPRQPAVRRIARLREHRQGPAPGRQDQEDRAALPGAVPAAAQARRPGGGDRARRRAVRLDQGPQGTAPHPGRGPEARRHRLAALRRVQALRRGVDRDPAVHQDQLRRHRPRLVLRPRKPTAAASTTSAPRCSPTTSSAPTGER